MRKTILHTFSDYVFRTIFFSESPVRQATEIAGVVKKWLDVVGLDAATQVLFVPSNTRRRLFILCVDLADCEPLTPDDALCLRVLLTRKIEFELGFPKKAIRLILYFNTDPRDGLDPKIPLSAEWMQARLARYQTGRPKFPRERVVNVEVDILDKDTERELAELEALKKALDHAIDIREASMSEYVGCDRAFSSFAGSVEESNCVKL